ncbi:PucR family transcriptional regulator [Streptacidiphilus sp. MAP5-3]|uniref:PucR family transcriptional regulator n=1 Tax=unclassified Streptacidiphilus TaxID=2643834 RepID=UPI003519539D
MERDLDDRDDRRDRDVVVAAALSEQARALATRCESRVNELARRITGADFAVFSAYRDLPEDMKHTEMAATVRHGLRLFFTVVREGRAGLPEEFRLFRERAAQRAEEGMPLQLLLRIHLVSLHALFAALREEAGPGEETALVELADLLLRTQSRLIGAVAETYLDEQSALSAERRESRRTLARALLAGFPVLPGRIEENGLARGALVVAFGSRATGGSSSEASQAARSARSAQAAESSEWTEASRSIALGRRMRRVHGVLERTFGPEVLAVVEAEGGHVLVPREQAAGGLPVGLGERIGEAWGADVWVATTVAEDPAQIAAAGRTAAEVLRLVRALGRRPGHYRLDDVLLEYHLSRGDESSAALAGLLDPLADRPDLLETLRVYLALQQDRRGTARELGLHPNTVDNRLARAGELTGVDVTSPRGYAVMLTAFTLHDLRQPEPG